ncbi:alpha/beta fold hydrolase [Spirillospora sp. CA-142024]|uniref:alpha/beta fold hydrolase n=1 Tax=Spirillospora sp. CA-142024 TaxID=3240036 RepID=UPI003D9080C4
MDDLENEMAVRDRPDCLVVGATGFIGRWLVAELLTRGQAVAVTVRGGGVRGGELRSWLREHDVDDTRLTVVDADITRPDLALSASDRERLEDVRDVFNAAALYRFGLEREEARRANVDGALNVLHWAGGLPRLRRLVHVSGYRVGADGALTYPLPEAESNVLYRKYGVYEASKREGDAAVRTAAAEAGVPLTVVNPAGVIGHSVTGEAGQYIGPAEMVKNLWAGRLPALAGTRRTFVPVVTIDHLARFMAAVPDHDEGAYEAHWVLDDATPELPEMIGLVARHLGLRAPRAILPVGLVRRLPRAVTGVEPETLTFLSEDRYDTASADTLGLKHPPVEDALRRWADRLVAERFGASRPTLPGGFHLVGNTRTYLAGNRRSPSYVLLHGLPFNAETWRDVVAELDAPALVADMPGLGRSARSAGDATEWLADLMAPVDSRPVLVGHSAGTAPVLRYAHAHPERVAGLVLVSPYFLQRRPRWHMRTPAFLAPMLRTASARRLGRALLGSRDQAMDDLVADLRRPGVAWRTARWLGKAQRRTERDELRALVDDCPVPVHIVAGEFDPLVGDPVGVPVTVVPGAGHNPQVTHPAQVAAAAG